jgi:hypothetical protein
MMLCGVVLMGDMLVLRGVFACTGEGEVRQTSGGGRKSTNSWVL